MGREGLELEDVKHGHLPPRAVEQLGRCAYRSELLAYILTGVLRALLLRGVS